MGTENKKMGGTYEAALNPARLWGIRETLEGVGDISQQEVSRIITAWAEEFAASGQSDLAAFFATKAQTVKAKGTNAHIFGPFLIKLAARSLPLTATAPAIRRKRRSMS